MNTVNSRNFKRESRPRDKVAALKRVVGGQPSTFQIHPRQTPSGTRKKALKKGFSTARVCDGTGENVIRERFLYPLTVLSRLAPRTLGNISLIEGEETILTRLRFLSQKCL